MTDEEKMIHAEPSRWKRFKSCFYKWGIEVCDGQWPCYGGHNHWICRLLRVDYLYIGLCFKFSYYHTWYDGQHHVLRLGLVYVDWGGWPYLDIK